MDFYKMLINICVIEAESVVGATQKYTSCLFAAVP